MDSSQDEGLLGLHWGGQAWDEVRAEDEPETEQGALEIALLILLLQLRPQGNLPACPGGSTYFLILPPNPCPNPPTINRPKNSLTPVFR